VKNLSKGLDMGLWSIYGISYKFKGLMVVAVPDTVSFSKGEK
jgi:hypothetical protein